MFLQQDTWCSKEFSSVKLGDQRLNRRLLKVAGDLLNYPTEPINAACNNWSEAKAAYRLFDNDKLQEAALLRVHQVETVKRLEKSDEIVFAIQDTTILNYTHHPKKKGLGKINKTPGYENPSMGCLLHNTLLMTESGLPLGLLDQKIFLHGTGEKTNHKRRPITEKESFRWIESLRTTKSLCPKKTIITVGDRESDIFELFVEADREEAKVLIRATNDRILIQDDEEHQTLWDHMGKTPLGGMETLQIPARHKQSERLAHLEVRYAEITLKPPQRYPGAKEKPLPPVKMQAVWFYERYPPSDTEHLEWMLLTNMPVSSVEDAVRVGQWYRLRWQIECYHRILKSGCKIEDCRLESYERLKKFIRLKSIIAFRLFWLTLINRVDPEGSSDKILEDHEWKALCCQISKNRHLPLKAPSIREAVRMIASLGGFLGRKSDKEPGMTYIWRGWEKLATIADFWLSMSLEATCG
jgi:Transposase DNA-binding/Transposase Tn5 dimerisation domain